MCALHMVVEMRCPQKRLFTTIVLTLENALISMRADMLLQTGRSIECLGAALEWTEMGL